MWSPDTCVKTDATLVQMFPDSLTVFSHYIPFLYMGINYMSWKHNLVLSSLSRHIFSLLLLIRQVSQQLGASHSRDKHSFISH